MKTFKTFIKENSESGDIKLTIDGKVLSHWFYIDDAIRNGILEDYIGLSDVDDIVEEYFQSLGDDDYYGSNLSDLSDYILHDFGDHMDHFLSYLMGHEVIDHKPDIEIKGEDEEGDDWNFSYYSEMYG